MTIVGDGSVFIALQRIDTLLVLPRLFGEVHVPDAVCVRLFCRDHVRLNAMQTGESATAAFPAKSPTTTSATS